MTAALVDLPTSTEEDVDRLLKSLDLPAAEVDPFGRPWICIVWPKAC